MPTTLRDHVAHMMQDWLDEEPDTPPADLAEEAYIEFDLPESDLDDRSSWLWELARSIDYRR